MHSPATALAWELWGRHRWGLAAFGAFILVYALVTATAPVADPKMFVSLGSMWFVMGLCYLIGVFTYGSEVRLETPDSGFPPRLFVLPVRTSVLVGWPMVQGILAAVLAWAVWDRFVLRPCGIETPFWWAAMLAAGVATTQAILWLPFGLPWVRLPVAIAVLTALVRAPSFLALAGERFADPDTQNTILSGIALVLIPAAFLVARAGVARTRRGDSPDWLRAIRSIRRAGEPRRERPPFVSAMRAQIWYEWRLRGLGFPLLVLFTLGVLMACGVLLERDDDRRTGFGMTFLFVPLLLAGFCGLYMGATGDAVRSLFGLPTFTATRPVSNSTVVVAKLWAAGLAAAVAWALAVALTLGWLVYTGGVRELPRMWERAVSGLGSVRAGVFCVLLAVGPVFVIWRMLVENLWVGLTGRAWVAHASAIVMVSVGLQLMYEWTLWNVDPGRQERILAALPWVAGVAVVLKLLAAGWALVVLHRRRERAPGTVTKILVAWSLVATGAFTLLVWVVSSDIVPLYGLAVGVVLFVPLTRLVIAPLALAWNRHR